MSKRFRVAFSFSEAKRPFVKQVADILAARFNHAQILFDEYHQAEFARAGLGFYLPALYALETDLVVAVLCQDYESNDWCGLEWAAIYSRIKERQVDEVMLCRFDRVEGLGLYGLAGYTELDGRTPAATADLILQRLAVNEGHADNYYLQPTASHDWPEDAPDLKWEVANHELACAAFNKLVTRASPHRLLCIHGGSETGKTHLTKQFHGNAVELLGHIACGRFDFKGSAEDGGQLGSFLHQLKIREPAPPGGLAVQLTHVFNILERHARPTLLIFDTFEMAGAAERWIKDSLLVALAHASSRWLRVVLVGQRVPDSHGEPWARTCAGRVKLRVPTAEEWHAYTRLLDLDISLEFVTQAHALCQGRSTVLAQLLGRQPEHEL